MVKLSISKSGEKSLLLKDKTIMIEVMVHFDEDKQNVKIAALRQKEEEDLASLLAERYGVEYADLSRLPINSDALTLIPEEESRLGKLAIFDSIGKRLKVAVLSPSYEKTQSILRGLESRGYENSVFTVSNAGLTRAWSRYGEITGTSEVKAGILDIANEEIQETISKIRGLGDVKGLIDSILSEKKHYKTSKVLEIILAGALGTGASDVHIEPEESFVRLRLRLDGVLTEILTFETDVYNLLLSRIKLISGLKLNLKNSAQDGRFSIKIKGDEIEIRTSTLPGAYGESVVLRILNPKSISVPMEELGIEPHLFQILSREIQKPNGMILVTGPTGSGKTTTLYAFLKKVHSPDIKIITIEDPIEYHLPGIVQTQANHKDYTFSEGLRAALRQDPDVIMVGEIRDAETAEIAINAGLTGHLVLSTLHTNTAAGSFPRLIDLGINPKVISSAVNIAIAQRLVRKLCKSCAKKVPVTPEQKKIIDETMTAFPLEVEKPQTEFTYEAVGCEICNGLGYKGRLGIFEAILVDEKVNQTIINNPSEREISDAAKTQSILSMRSDGIIKVLRGITSFEELSRVIDINLS